MDEVTPSSSTTSLPIVVLTLALLSGTFGLDMLAAETDAKSPTVEAILDTYGDSPPWHWPDDARLTLRFDSTLAQKRALDSLSHADGKIVIDGTTHPELLMPWEVFDHLIARGFLQLSDHKDMFWRRAAELTRPGLALQIRDVTMASSADFIENRQKQEILAAGLADADSQERRRILEDIRDLQVNSCRFRSAAFASTVQALGRTELLEFLYTVVAPTVRVVEDSRAGPERHRKIQEGCSAN